MLTRDQCEILSEADNVVSNNHLTPKDLRHKTIRRRGRNEKMVMEI